MRNWWVVLSIGLLVAAAGQQTDRWADFDLGRLYLSDETVFEPFIVTETIPLQRALETGLVEDETRVIVVPRRGGALALIQSQAAYHHVIQGGMDAEPWMVSF